MHIEEMGVVLACVLALVAVVAVDRAWIARFLLEPDSGLVAAAELVRCGRCGIIEAVEEVDFGALTSAAIAGSLRGHDAPSIEEHGLRPYRAQRVTVKMDDGSLRTVYQQGLTASVGQRVKMVNGALKARIDG